MKDPKELFKGKKVLILGLGVNQGGVGATRFFANAGARVKVTDLKTKDHLATSLKELEEFVGIKYILGEHRLEDIDWADLIIKNPAIKPDNPYLLYALKTGKQVELDMGIFLQFVSPQQIIGITGTKGKSTTFSLIYEILKNAKHINSKKSAGVLLRKASNTNPPQGWTFKKIVFAGNIGKSVLDVVPYVKKNTLVVLEISSFQLEAFETHQISPKWAVITNITPDHLNYYQNMDEYIQSKKVIGKYQTEKDFLFVRKNDPVVDKENFLKNLRGQIIYFSTAELPENFKPTLKGQHNLENIAAAYQVGKTFNINPSLIFSVLTNFKGIPFRMELTKQWHRVRIYNDSAATNPAATIQALKALGPKTEPDGYPKEESKIILICGGMNKNLQFEDLAKAVVQYAKKVYFIDGDATEELKTQISKLKIASQNLKLKGTYSDLEKLLIDVKKEAKSRDVILFSPGATSFNLFQNEFDRGRKFNAAVEKIF